jgi:hypothetical protein
VVLLGCAEPTADSDSSTLVDDSGDAASCPPPVRVRMLDCLSQASLENDYRVELSVLRSSSCEDRIPEDLADVCLHHAPSWCDDEGMQLAIADACLDELQTGYPSSDRVDQISEPSTDAKVRDLLDSLREADICTPEATSSCQTRARGWSYGHDTPVGVEELLAWARDGSSSPGLHVYQVVDEPAAAHAVLSSLAAFGARRAFDAMLDAHQLDIEQLRFGHASGAVAAEVLLGTAGTCGGFVSVANLPRIGAAIAFDIVTCTAY